MDRFGKDCRLRSVTEEMLGFLQTIDVAKEVSCVRAPFP